MRSVDVRRRQARDPRHDPAPPTEDDALGRQAENAREPEHGDRLYRGGEDDRDRQPGEQLCPSMRDDLVDEDLWRERHDEAGGAIDEEQDEAEAEPLALTPDDCPRERDGCSGSFVEHRDSS